MSTFVAAVALLDLEQLGGTEHLTRAPVDLPELTASAVNPHRTAAARDHRTITVDTAPATVDVDASWIRPAIGNLVDNALRHGHGDIHHGGRPRREPAPDRHR
ncbi:hypothetical protein ABZT43_42755 [Streptomyces sp. NPDC005349]|uniref:hypothetical protein n=1 Tax=Streptomyces sp. NPDC005349 TaxID=3157037 RepID=UPI0033AB4134